MLLFAGEEFINSSFGMAVVIRSKYFVFKTESNNIRDRGVFELSKLSCWKRLSFLGLCDVLIIVEDNFITAKGCSYLAKGDWPSIDILYLGNLADKIR